MLFTTILYIEDTAAFKSPRWKFENIIQIECNHMKIKGDIGTYSPIQG